MHFQSFVLGQLTFHVENEQNNFRSLLQTTYKNKWMDFFGIKYGRMSYTFKIKREFLYKTKLKKFNVKDCHFCTTKFNERKHKP